MNVSQPAFTRHRNNRASTHASICAGPKCAGGRIPGSSPGSSTQGAARATWSSSSGGGMGRPLRSLGDGEYNPAITANLPALLWESSPQQEGSPPSPRQHTEGAPAPGTPAARRKRDGTYRSRNLARTCWLGTEPGREQRERRASVGWLPTAAGILEGGRGSAGVAPALRGGVLPPSHPRQHAELAGGCWPRDSPRHHQVHSV